VLHHELPLRALRGRGLGSGPADFAVERTDQGVAVQSGHPVDQFPDIGEAGLLCPGIPAQVAAGSHGGGDRARDQPGLVQLALHVGPVHVVRRGDRELNRLKTPSPEFREELRVLVVERAGEEEGVDAEAHF
jgi:hypothetical protein